VRANFFTRTTGSNSRGFTLFELVVVISVVSVLAFFALDRYYRLLVEVERTAMEHNLGVMRSALAMEVTASLVEGDRAAVQRLIGSNPMDLLVELPHNYDGSVSSLTARTVAPGRWYFDASGRQLVYKVQHQLYLESKSRNSGSIAFTVEPLYTQRMSGRYLAGLRIQPVNEYRWLTID